MAGVTTSNLISGPATVYVGAYAATEPADSAVNTTPAASAWTDIGGTTDGLTITFEAEYFELDADQLVMTPESRLTKLKMMAKTNFAEATLENLKYALNSIGTIASGSGYKSYDPEVSSSASQPTYVALLIDGWAPMVSGVAKRRRVIMRKCLQTGSVETAYKKDGQTLFPTEWTVHYIDSSTKPYHVVDQTT